VNAIVNFAQIVKERRQHALWLQHSAIPITVSYPSLNELCSKKNNNNLDELINIPTKAEEKFMIAISFRT